MEDVSKSVKKYLEDVVFISAYQLGWTDSDNQFLKDNAELKRELKTDTTKCMAVSSLIGVLAKFSKGRAHYTGYLKSLFLGASVGFGISVYYTAEKTRNRLTRLYYDQSQQVNDNRK